MAAQVDVRARITRSQETFRDSVWPHITARLGGGELIPVETVTDSDMALALDTLAGVDMWWVISGQVYPIASRVQYGSTAWRTFTVRASRPSGAATELHKRRHAIETGALYPSLTVQAYVNPEGRLMAAAAVSTRHLIDRCSDLKDQRRVNPQDGSEFIYVQWDQCDADRIFIVGEQR